MESKMDSIKISPKSLFTGETKQVEAVVNMLRSGFAHFTRSEINQLKSNDKVKYMHAITSFKLDESAITSEGRAKGQSVKFATEAQVNTEWSSIEKLVESITDKLDAIGIDVVCYLTKRSKKSS
jgi:hypothetical protein